MKKVRKILVTTGLPYANASLHLGHILEQIQADIWVRWQKLCGADVIFISGDDAHGTPIMLSAQKAQKRPEDWIEQIKIEHTEDLKAFEISLDNFYTTHSKENHELTVQIYEALRVHGDIQVLNVKQLYDDEAKMFLPDRFVKGTCPRCKANDQYGDNCEICGASYDALELIDPISSLSNSKPIEKHSEHYFFSLEKYAAFLREWTRADQHLQKEIGHKLDEWFKAGLKNWDISRDAPYFGFAIPDAPDKYFYVWLDAPIGYMASFKNLCSRNPNLNFSEYWGAQSQTELYHFVGKDIIYFHALFWPAVLHGANFRTPTSIFTHGFVTVNGQKMSKSRGNFITARQYLNELQPEYLRYYLATKLNDSIDDLDFNLADFVQRNNSELVGKVVNIASRSAPFITKHFQGKLAEQLADEKLFHKFVEAGEKISKCYLERKYSEALREIMFLADLANQYIDAEKPWTLAKDPHNLSKVQAVASQSLNLFRLLALYLKPVLPTMVDKVEEFLNIPPLNFASRGTPLLNHTILEFKPLMQRLDLKQAEKILQQ